MDGLKTFGYDFGNISLCLKGVRKWAFSEEVIVVLPINLMLTWFLRFMSVILLH